MPLFYKIFLSLALAVALAPFTSAEDTPNQVYNQIDNSNVTFVKGTYHSADRLSKRAIPLECTFAGVRGDYTYIKAKVKEGTACVGYDNSPTCGKGVWEGKEFEDIQKAMAEIVAMDGWLSDSKAGEWEGRFPLGTSAFKNRDTSVFTLGLLFFDIKPTKIYWSRDGDFASVERNDGICP